MALTILRLTNRCLRITPTLKQNFESVRPSSYQSSEFLEDLGDLKVKYKVTNDPTDWKYVERTLPLLLVPEPARKDKYPSGWKPQANDLRDRPYFIERTKNHLIPVYLHLGQRGIRRHTVIRKIQGDIFLLEKEIKEFIKKEYGTKRPLRSQVNEFVGYIRINGDYVNAIKYWLEQRDF